MSSPDQPSNSEIQRAWTAAIECENIGGARAETRQHLEKLMNRRTSWFGTEEIQLMWAVKSYLKGEPL